MRKLGQSSASTLWRSTATWATARPLDGVVEVAVGDRAARSGRPWKAALRDHVMAARAVMPATRGCRGSWRNEDVIPPPAHIDAVLATLLAGGFSMELAHHALHSLSSRIFGFHQDLFDDSGRGPADPEAEARVVAMLAVSYPSLAELAKAASHEGGLGACDDDVEFAFGLDLILDGLERLQRSSRR